MLQGLNYHSLEFSYPVKQKPEWTHIEKRWYQLDAYSYGLCQAYYIWQKKLIKPSMIILASPGASNEMDFNFVKSGAKSPSKMVHTLPNIRCASMIKLMEWAGPVLCLQKDPVTQIHAIKEAVILLGEVNTHIWVVSCQCLTDYTRLSDENNSHEYRVDFFELQNQPVKKDSKVENFFEIGIDLDVKGQVLVNDTSLIAWFEQDVKEYPCLNIGEGIIIKA